MPGMNLDQWKGTVKNNLVTISRESDLILDLLIGPLFPQLEEVTLAKIRDLVVETYQKYVWFNARGGCLDRRSIKFNPIATYQPEDAEQICREDYKFGGTFASTIYCSQTNSQGQCTASMYPCQEYHVLNNERRCPDGYSHKTAFLASNPWFNLTECVGKSAVDRGVLLFGGIYSTNAVNPVTGAKTCPEYFSAHNLFDCSKNIICLSRDAERGVSNAVPFGGFISSCIVQHQQECQEGYRKIFVNAYNNCALYYCAQIKDMAMPDIIPPPFDPY